MPQRAALGQALRELRRAKGLTGVELAREVGVTQVSVSRYESGERLPPLGLLEKMADALGVSKRLKRELLDQLHRAQTELESARAIAQRGLGRRQEEIARIEAKATYMRNFQAAVVPGLLQTRDYARSIFERAIAGTRPEDVARALVVRLDRQAVLHDPSKRFGFVIMEAVLLSPRGGTPGMLAQLDRIQTVSEFPNVDLAILPLGVEPPHNPINSFGICDEDLVLVETLTEQLAIRDPADIALYIKAYEAFRAAALSGSEAVEKLESVAARLRHL